MIFFSIDNSNCSTNFKTLFCPFQNIVLCISLSPFSAFNVLKMLLSCSLTVLHLIFNLSNNSFNFSKENSFSDICIDQFLLTTYPIKLDITHLSFFILIHFQKYNNNKNQNSPVRIRNKTNLRSIDLLHNNLSSSRHEAPNYSIQNRNVQNSQFTFDLMFRVLPCLYIDKNIVSLRTKQTHSESGTNGKNLWKAIEKLHLKTF